MSFFFSSLKIIWKQLIIVFLQQDTSSNNSAFKRDVDSISEMWKRITVAPRLTGLFDYPDFFSGPVFVFMNIN